jgi:hypothetical protein
VQINTLFQPLGGVCAADNDGDPVVVFDKLAKRWVISQFAVTAAPYYQCVAVSKTDDATGGDNLYAFNDASVFPDYPTMGVWPDGCGARHPSRSPSLEPLATARVRARLLGGKSCGRESPHSLPLLKDAM